MGILQTDALVLDQVRSFLSNDFGIHDLTGAPMGRIVMSGAMKDSMKGPPPGWPSRPPARDICWISTRPPGRTASCSIRA